MLFLFILQLSVHLIVVFLPSGTTFVVIYKLIIRQITFIMIFQFLLDYFWIQIYPSSIFQHFSLASKLLQLFQIIILYIGLGNIELYFIYSISKHFLIKIAIYLTINQQTSCIILSCYGLFACFGNRFAFCKFSIVVKSLQISYPLTY